MWTSRFYKSENPEVYLATGTTGNNRANIVSLPKLSKFKSKEMRYSDYQKAFSHSRLDRYLTACAGDRRKALLLYRYNIRLCKEFYAILGILEVTLRNSINSHYQSQFGLNNWLEVHAQNTGVFSNLVFQHGNYESRKLILSNIRKLNARYTHDRLVSSLSFGFWVMLFNKLQFNVCGKTLHNIFVKRPIGTLPRDIYKELDKIRDFRNRVAHHEPLCFDSLHNKKVAYAQQHYDLIRKYAQWLNFNPDKLFYGIDNTQDTINKIDEL